MAEAVRPRRESRRTLRKSYRVEEAFPDLESEGSDHESGIPSINGAVEEKMELDSEPDKFLPDPVEEDQKDDFLEDEVDEEHPEHLHSDAESVEERALRTESTRKAKRRLPPVSIKRTIKDRRFRATKEPPQESVADSGTKVRQGLEKVHARGVEQFGRIGGIETRIKDMFGPTYRELVPIMDTRDHWVHQETLPSRVDDNLRRSFHMPEGVREREVKNVREWYSGKGKTAFTEGQKTSVLDEEAGAKYLGNPGPAFRNVLLGPFNEPQLYKMSAGSYLSTATPFANKKDRRGWIFNLGSRIQEAQWSANEEGSTQYLAVAVEQVDPNPKVKYKPMENPEAPAFSATAPFPASIQIWAFDSTSTHDLDPEKEPRLELAICTDWGAPKHFRWCPIAATEPPDNGNTIHLGLLAAYWSDGRVRILDISYPKPDPDAHKTHYLHFSHAAFDVQIPQTIPSCLHWLSGNSLAVGSASGTVGIWSLSRPETFPFPRTEQHNPQPWFYKLIADTYILSLSSGYPSRPNFLSITTADGFAKLIDLRSPLLDTCLSQRGRSLCLSQAWHEHTQAFIMSDDYYMVRSNVLRRYYTSIYNMRSESSIVCVAASPVQPAVLVGSVDGTVQASNPLTRLMNEKEIPWHHIWFKHEWRPSVDKLLLKVREESSDEMQAGDAAVPSEPQSTTLVTQLSNKGTDTTDTAMIDTSKAGPDLPHHPKHRPKSKVPPEVLTQPLTRITEGYKVQKVFLVFPKPYEAFPNSGGKYVTTFEEPSAVTTLAWNPNLKFGTWAVAGMGDGILRVEDLNV
ncbi:hypothetical protein K504DRAFT_488720 [Pleomassaria siparia CBS 279.74]|uniref:WD40 repeat-like protein n=1 Tax=Pleomassaria siparia CBS 279.74 TaxID=1314801 RepID=A0A6G1KIR5_9PLEO|nr:hypothetical protein K504DRAFT_488720 [Pleomassaria siparia CBS 279.74]